MSVDQLQPQPQPQSQAVCRLCGHGGCEVTVLGCGCPLHARCVPVSIFAQYRHAVECNNIQSTCTSISTSTSSNTSPNIHIPCPSPTCNSQKGVTGFYIYPLSLDNLEEAGRKNYNDCLGEASNQFGGKIGKSTKGVKGVKGQKRKRGKDAVNANMNMSTNTNTNTSHNDDLVSNDDTQTTQSVLTKTPNTEEETIHASASPFLLWSNSPSSTDSHSQNSGHDRLHFRTGRWSTCETEYVDLLISSFDSSSLALPHGIKLNEFLRDILMCKSSRLTKKMKNAKLSHRSYRFENANTSLYNNTSYNNTSQIQAAQAQAIHECQKMSQAQQEFLNSIPSEVTRLVMKFNISRTWRIHFSNLCLQAGYGNNGNDSTSMSNMAMLSRQDWLDSLDEFDKRVNMAEDSVRQCRRNRLVKALRKDSMQDSIDGVYFGGTSTSTSGRRSSHTQGSNLNNSSSSSSPLKKQIIMPSVKLASLTTHFTHYEPTLPTLPAVTAAAAVVTGQPAVPPVIVPISVPTVNTATVVTHSPRTDQGHQNANSFDDALGDFSITSIKVNPTPMNDIYMNHNGHNNGYGRGHEGNNRNGHNNDNYNDNFSIDFLDLEESVNGDFLSLKDMNTNTTMNMDHTSSMRQSYKSKNVFLSHIMTYIEEQSIPFHCIDCWVPCNRGVTAGDVTGNESVELSNGDHDDPQSQHQPQLRLVHAGDDFHSDLTSLTEYHLHEFGLYSKNFSFAPGAGMPGRCYTTNNYCWENNIQEASPEHFKRLGGAKYAGIQSAIGIPMHCSMIGTIVIGLYSLFNLTFDESIVQKCTVEFQKFNPEPKWSLSIDIPTCEQEKPEKSSSSQQQQPVHTQFSNAGNASNTSNHSVHSSSDSHSQSSASNALSTCSTNDSITLDQAMNIANLLAEHMNMPSSSLDLDEEGNKSEHSIRSLRMLLLQCPNNVPTDVLNKLVILKKSYEGYCKVQRKKSDVVKLLISDWEFLSKEDDKQRGEVQSQHQVQAQGQSQGEVQSQHHALAGWGLPTMTHVNYSSQKMNVQLPNLRSSQNTTLEQSVASQVTPKLEDFSSNTVNITNHVSNNDTRPSAFMLPPTSINDYTQDENTNVTVGSLNSYRIVSNASLANPNKNEDTNSNMNVNSNMNMDINIGGKKISRTASSVSSD